MNTIYRIVWNTAARKWVVASELAKGRTKPASRALRIATAVALATLGGTAFAATATNPAGTVGNAAIDIAMGSSSQASCTSSFLNGFKNVTPMSCVAGTAVGNNASALLGGTAMGDHATATNSFAVAIGAYSSAAAWSTAVGPGAFASGQWAVALGWNALAKGDSSFAMGDTAIASGSNSFAFGSYSRANSDAAMAIGQKAVAGTVDGSGNPVGSMQVAIGDSSSATGDRSVVIGASSKAAVVNAVALGTGSVADRAGTVSVGTVGAERRIANVEQATSDTDAVTLAQLKPVVAGLGGGAGIDATTGTVTGPTYAVGGNSYTNVGDALGNLDARSTTNATGIANINRYFKTSGLNDGTDDASIAAGATGAVAIGTSANAVGRNSIVMGNGARTEAFFGGTNTAGAVAIGNGAYAATGNTAINRASVAMGNAATANHAGSVAIGDNAVAAINTVAVPNGSFGVSIGTDATSANGASAIGYLAKAMGNGATSLGIRSSAAGVSSVAIGTSASASADTSVALGSNSVASVANTVSVGSDSIKRKIVNIANGVDANDAVNVSQLKSSADSVAAAIGGGSTAQADGTITAPTYSVGGTTVNNIGSAITNLDGRVTDNSTAITNLQAGVGEATRFFKADGSSAASDDTVASGFRASAMGAAASATSSMGIAIGFGATASIGDNAVAIGSNSRATGENAVAIGAGSVADRDNTVSVGMGSAFGNGSRQIVNVTNGTENGDAVNVQQLKPVIAALGGGASFNASQGTVGAPTYNVAGGTFNNVGDALGGIDSAVTKNAGDIVSINNQFAGMADSLAGAVMYGTLADGSVDTGTVNFAGTNGTQLKNVANGTDAKDAVNLGQLNSAIAGASAGDTRYFKADGKNDGSDDAQLASVGSVAIGAGSVASRDNTVSVGSAGNERAITNVAAGSEDTDAVNVSQLKAVQGQVGALDALAVKYDDASKGSITLGGANGTQIKNVAAGSDDTDAVNVAQLKASGLVGSDGSTLDAVVYDAGSDRGQVTFGGVAGTRLANVMAGAVGPLSMDAINGSQLWAVQQQVNQLGDRVTNVENGMVVAPSLPVTDPVIVKQDGLATSGSGVAAANADNATAIGNGAQANADNSVALGHDSVADRANSVSVGSTGNERQITNVAAGTERTDAANWGQVQDALQTANRYTDDRVDALGKKLGDYQRQANRGIAASSALVNVTPYIPGKTVLNAGVATYRGESAMGVGLSRWNDTGRVNLNAGMSAARGDQPIFRVGVGIVLGD